MGRIGEAENLIATLDEAMTGRPGFNSSLLGKAIRGRWKVDGSKVGIAAKGGEADGRSLSIVMKGIVMKGIVMKGRRDFLDKIPARYHYGQEKRGLRQKRTWYHDGGEKVVDKSPLAS